MTVNHSISTLFGDGVHVDIGTLGGGKVKREGSDGEEEEEGEEEGKPGT